MELDQIDAFTVLGWMNLHEKASVDWSVGGLLISAATVAALATLFSTSPSDLPWLGGTERVRGLQQKLTDLERLQEDVLCGARIDDGMADKREKHIKHVSRELRAERRSLVLRGVPIFLVVGPVLAAALATTLWQALLIGATGPATLRAISLRRKQDDLAETSRSAISDLSVRLESATRSSTQAGSLAPPAAGPSVSTVPGGGARESDLLEAAYAALEALR